MARKEMTYRVTDEGRDDGKAFFIREMPAEKAEWWAIRAMLAMGKNGIELPSGIEQAGFAAIASWGINLVLRLPPADAKELLDEMFTCIECIPQPAKPELRRALVESDIEDVGTRFKLRIAVFNLHADFLKAVGKSILVSKSPETNPTV